MSTRSHLELSTRRWLPSLCLLSSGSSWPRAFPSSGWPRPTKSPCWWTNRPSLPTPQVLHGATVQSSMPRRFRARSRPAGKMEGRTARPPESSRTNADDRLSHASLGRVEGGDSFVEGRDVANVPPQSSVPHPLDDLTQLGTIALDDEVDRPAVSGPCLAWPNDGHQCSSGSNQACGPLPDVAADEIEHQIDSADVFEGLVVEVDELLRAESERLLTVGGASGADDVGAGLSCELRHHRPDCA